MKNKKLMVAIIAALLAALMVITLIVGLIPTHVHAAESSSSLKSELNGLKEEKKELQDQMDEIGQQIADNYTEMEKIAAEKNVIDQEIGLLNQQIVNINEQIKVYGMLIADKQDELDAAQAHLTQLNEENKERIRAMEEDGSLSYWSVLFKANSFADLLDRLNMIEEIAAADQRRLQEISDAAEVVAQAQAELETEKVALEASKAELDGMMAELEKKRAEADSLLAQLIAKGEEYEAMMDDAEAEAEELLKEIAQKEKEYNEARRQEQAAANASRPNTNTGATPPANVVDGITWVIPCSYSRLSSPYGWRDHPVHGDWRFHSGVDLAAPSGTPIYASRSGTVTTATYNGSAGYYVTVNHGDGFSTSYLHMTHYVVKAGQQVDAGQVIGYVGSTGTSTGPHLHFTIYYNGNTVNPATYINFY